VATGKYTAFRLPRELFAKLLNQRVTVRASGCWEWVSSKNPSGYGMVHLRGQRFLAHRAAIYAFRGVDPGPMLVCHKCDNPSCCNPEHLFLGTAADNTRDFIAKGRNQSGDAHWTRRLPHLVARGSSHASRTLGTGFYSRGESHYMSKLSDAQVEEVRMLLASGLSLGALASRYAVSKPTIWKISKGRTRVPITAALKPNLTATAPTPGPPGPTA